MCVCKCVYVHAYIHTCTQHIYLDPQESNTFQ